MACPVLETERLFLREWRDPDVDAFIIMNADPLVMEFFPETYSDERTRRFVDRIRECWAERGYGLWAVERKWPATFPPTSPHGLWAVERKDTATFIGHVGLWPATFPAHFTPAVEVGWRIAADQWGHGYATEAARAALAYGFDSLGLDENVPEGHSLRPHVLYRINRKG